VMASVDFSTGAHVDAAGGEIIVDPPATLRVVGPGGHSTVVLDGLGRSNYVEVWCSEHWCLLMGARDRNLVLVRPHEGTAEVLGQLDRLDLDDVYDPGGLERVAFHELSDGDVLVEHEVGLARVSPDRGLVWQRVHDDLTARVSQITDEAVWLHGESDRFGYNLVDGRSPFYK
jgi:hypothetical protein